jgi:uncharacterized repeat protein (TIGR01451 family)
MKRTSERERHERQDWGIVLLILLIGFLCVIVAGQRAMSFAPRWTLDANVESNIDLNSEFRTSQPVGYFEPLDPAILTQPGWAWANAFLTPGASIPVGTPLAGSPPNTMVPTVSGTTPTITGTVPPTSTGTIIPTNTLVWIPLPATNTPKPKDPPPADTPTDTPVPPPPNADLTITIDDNADDYAPGTPRTYRIVVSNNGPDPVSGATVTDTFPSQFLSVVYGSCTHSVPAESCGWTGSGSISVIVNLPAGSSITYDFQVNTNSDPVNLQNTASVTGPTGYLEANPGDESDTDTDTLLTYGTRPGEFDTSGCADRWDFDCTYEMSSGDTITFASSSPITRVAGPDLIYYERPTHPASIEMDFVKIEVSDGYNWYTIFDWGGGVVANTNISGFPENDNQIIPFTSLYPSGGTGITIDIDSLPITAPGPFSYIRVTASMEPAAPYDGIAIDAILPP